MKRMWSVGWAVALAVVLAGCGGGGESSSTPSGAATLDGDGGKIVTASAEVLVPPGAMSTPATIRIAADATGAPALPAWASAAGEMLQITPHGSTFSEPVTVRLSAPNVSLAEDERLMIAKAQPGGSWEVLADTERVGDQLEVRVTSFSYFTPVIVKFDPLLAATTQAPFTMSPPSFSCGGAACATPVMLANTAMTVTSSGNGGTLPAGCVNPTVQLKYRNDVLRAVPATPGVVLSHDIQWSSLSALYSESTLRLNVALSCIDPASNAASVLNLASGSIGVDSFSGGPTTPAIRQFPEGVTVAPGDTVTLSGVLTRGASFRTGANTFQGPTGLDEATVYLERLVPGDTVWRTAASAGQSSANPRPTGAPAWAYWGLDFTLPAVTAADNGTLYRLRACYRAPTATTTACAIGPVATLTVVQQTLAPAFTQQPVSLLVQPGQTASFSARATGTPAPTLQWQTRAAGQTEWAPATTGVGAATGDYTTAAVTLADNGRQYRLVATNAAGESASDTVTLSVSAAMVAPSIVAQPVSLAVVAGSEAVFGVSAQGTAALSYQWLHNGVALPGANAPQLKLPAVSTDDAGSYAVRVSNAAGQVLSDAAVLAVNAMPTITPAAPIIVTQPAAVAVHEGNVATFAVSANGSGPLTYQWYRDGQALAGANAAAYTLPAVTLAQAGNYAVVVTNAAGSVTSQAATLGVAPALSAAVAPAITTQPVSVFGLPGATTTLAVAASGTGPLSYQWSRDGVPVSGANGPTLTFDSLDAAATGQYTVTVSNAVGSVTSAAALLQVIGAPEIKTQPVAAAVSEGAAATFGVQATGSGVRYQWTRNGVAIDGATAASYTTPALTLADNGAVYAVIVYNGAGLVTSGGAVLTVAAAPPPVSIGAAGTLATGNNHSCALRADGRMACWGSNANGQLGNGGFGDAPVTTPVVWDLAEPVKQVAAGTTGSCALTATTGRVFCSGHVAQAWAPTELAGFSGVKAVAMGALHACLIASDDTVWCWGGNNQYELGNGSNSGSFTPVQVLADVGVPLTGAQGIDSTNRHSCALVGGGAVRCWGQNGNAQLGYASFSSYAGDPGYARLVPGLSGATQVSAGGAHSCALMTDTWVQCWGDNSFGQMGRGTVGSAASPVTTPDIVWELSGVVQLRSGIRHTCALLEDGRLRCWGTAPFGDATASRTAPLWVQVTDVADALSVDAGDAHTCALRAGGAVWCWGANTSGQLGTGDTDERLLPAAHAGGAVFWAP